MRRAERGSLAAGQPPLPARGALRELGQALVEPEGPVPAGLLAKDRVRVLVEEERPQLARRVRGGDHVDASVEEAHRLEGEAVSVRPQVGRLAVEHHAQRLAGHRAESPRRVAVGLLEVAQDGRGVIVGGLAEVGIVVDAEVRMGDVDPLVLASQAALRRRAGARPSNAASFRSAASRQGS